jgi:multidrug efflux pump subunit AcrA (membrane-fusion protein)
MKSSYHWLRQSFIEHKWLAIAGVVLVFALFVFLFSRAGSNEAGVATPDETARQVRVASISALSSSGEGLTLLGELRSQSEAELRIVRGGEVTAVHVQAGDSVSAGTVLASVKNSAEQAAVTQARGALSAAQAQLDKLRAGTRQEDLDVLASQEVGASQSLTEANAAAVNAFRQAYTLAESAVFGTADNFFRNPRTVRPNFAPISANIEEARALEDERVEIGDLLETWKADTVTVSAGNAVNSLESARTRLNRVKQFLDQVSIMISRQEIRDDLTQETIDAQEASILAARQSIDAALAAVSGASSGITAARQGADVAGAQLERAQAGERPEDIRAAEAAVTQAQGSVQAALASLEQTLIRTPISGTVSTLNLTQGGFAPVGGIAAVVSNDNALEIEAFVAGDTKDRIAVGDQALIEDRYTGVVTTVEPGLDPITKKSRVTIGLTDPNAQLTNGQFVSISVRPSTEDVAPVAGEEFAIPITAIKILADGYAVFTVDENNILVEHPITEGPIVGDAMLVSDIDPNLQIVADARGLRAGDSVIPADL